VDTWVVVAARLILVVWIGCAVSCWPDTLDGGTLRNRSGVWQ
jgi:hypothetical protein